MSRLVAGWPAEALADWHERVGMRLEHLRQPWPTDAVRRAEVDAAADVVREGRHGVVLGVETVREGR